MGRVAQQHRAAAHTGEEDDEGPAGMGIRFLNMAEGDDVAVDEYLAQRPPYRTE